MAFLSNRGLLPLQRPGDGTLLASIMPHRLGVASAKAMKKRQ
jgi:hypothetical protein